jgi:hypothetical protein
MPVHLPVAHQQPLLNAPLQDFELLASVLLRTAFPLHETRGWTARGPRWRLSNSSSVCGRADTDRGDDGYRDARHVEYRIVPQRFIAIARLLDTIKWVVQVYSGTEGLPCGLPDVTILSGPRNSYTEQACWAAACHAVALMGPGSNLLP